MLMWKRCREPFGIATYYGFENNVGVANYSGSTKKNISIAYFSGFANSPVFELFVVANFVVSQTLGCRELCGFATTDKIN